MDLHEWEILSESDEGLLLDYKDDETKIVSAKGSDSAYDAKIVFDMNYFLSPSSMDSSNHNTQPSRRLPKQPMMIPLHLQLDSPIAKEKDNKVPMVISVVPSAEEDRKEADHDTVTQVFFKKTKENEFVDMKIDSPRSSHEGTKAQLDVGCYQFDDGSEAKESITNSPNQKGEEDGGLNWEGCIGGLKVLKWSLNGIGAICSFGVAAAILFYGGNQQQKLRIQIYTNDKASNSNFHKLKQAVEQASRLNEAISAARRLPQTRAHITCGGRYDGL